MKKLFAIILAIFTTLSLYSCLGDSKKSDSPLPKHSSSCKLSFKVRELSEEGKVLPPSKGHDGYLCLSCGIDLPPIYNSFSGFSPNGLALASIDGDYFVINTNGKKVYDLPYNDCESLSDQIECYKVVKDGKCGAVNAEGKALIPLTYDEILSNGVDAVAAISGETTTIFDMTGKQLATIPYAAKEFISDTLLHITSDTSAGYDYPVNGLAKTDGTIVASPEYLEPKNLRDYLCLIKEVEYEQNGDIEYGYDEYYYYADGTFLFVIEATDRVTDVESSSEGDWLVVSTTRDAKNEIYYKGTKVTEQYVNFTSFIYDEARECLEYLMLKTPVGYDESIGNLYEVLIIDSKGNSVIELSSVYVDNTLVDGYLMVISENGFGAINLNGEVVKEPIYDMNDKFFERFFGPELEYDMNANAILYDRNGNIVLQEGENAFIIYQFVYQNDKYYCFQREFGGVLEIIDENLEPVATYKPSYKRAAYISDHS